MVNGNQHNQHGILWHTIEANGPGPFAPLPQTFVVYGHFLSVDGSMSLERANAVDATVGASRGGVPRNRRLRPSSTPVPARRREVLELGDRYLEQGMRYWDAQEKAARDVL